MSNIVTEVGINAESLDRGEYAKIISMVIEDREASSTVGDYILRLNREGAVVLRTGNVISESCLCRFAVHTFKQGDKLEIVVNSIKGVSGE